MHIITCPHFTNHDKNLQSFRYAYSFFFFFFISAVLVSRSLSVKFLVDLQLHLAVLQAQHGLSYHDLLLSIAFGVGTIYQEHFSCTTQTLCLHRKAIFRLLYAMSRSMPTLQLTMTCTTFLGILLPSSIHTPSQLMTPPR